MGVPALRSVGGGLAGLPGIDANIPTSASYPAQTPGALCHQQDGMSRSGPLLPM